MPYMWVWFGDKAKKALDRACKQFTWEHDIWSDPILYNPSSFPFLLQLTPQILSHVQLFLLTLATTTIFHFSYHYALPPIHIYHIKVCVIIATFY